MCGNVIHFYWNYLEIPGLKTMNIQPSHGAIKQCILKYIAYLILDRNSQIQQANNNCGMKNQVIKHIECPLYLKIGLHPKAIERDSAYGHTPETHRGDMHSGNCVK